MAPLPKTGTKVCPSCHQKRAARSFVRLFDLSIACLPCVKAQA